MVKDIRFRQQRLLNFPMQQTYSFLSYVSTEDEVLSSLGIVVGLDRLRRVKITRDEYVKKYGHRGPHEAEMSNPRPVEDPNWINEQLEDLERPPVGVETLLQEQRARCEAALKSMLKAAPQEFDSCVKRIKEAARLTRLWEYAHAERVRTWWIERVFVLRSGALCGLGEEAFFLEHDEIIRLLNRQDEATRQIPPRRTAYQKFTALPEYPTIIVGRFDPFTWDADPNRRTDIYDASHRSKRLFTDQIKGLASQNLKIHKIERTPTHWTISVSGWCNTLIGYCCGSQIHITANY